MVRPPASTVKGEQSNGFGCDNPQTYTPPSAHAEARRAPNEAPTRTRESTQSAKPSREGFCCFRAVLDCSRAMGLWGDEAINHYLNAPSPHCLTALRVHLYRITGIPASVARREIIVSCFAATCFKESSCD